MKTKLFFGSLFFICTNLAYSTTYYSSSAGALNLTTSWWSNAAGTALPHPANFITAGNTFIIVNNVAPTITAIWTVSGAGSVIQVGDGVQLINFTIPTAFRVTGTIGVQASSTLTIATATNPTMGALSAGSTVVYSDAVAQPVLAATYYNLTLSGGGIKTLANTASSTINNVLTINTGVPFQLNTLTAYTLTLNGTIAGAGTITGGAASNLTIGGTGTFGTIIPTAAPLTLKNVNINRASLGSITLGNNVTVSTTCNFTNGVLILNGHTLTLNGTLTFPASSANGTITGSATSNLSIGAASITNPLCMTSGSETLNNFTLNSTGQTLNLGSILTVNGAYTQTRGIVNLNGNTLSLTGTATFATTAANGTTSGSATSNLLISATTITNSLFMTVGSQILNNFTLNSAGKTLTLGTTLTVSGVFTQTNGIVKLTAGQTLTLSGTVVFPVASANGTITGTATSNLIITATSITNSLFFTAAGQALSNFTVNSPGQTVIMGSPLTLSGTFTHTNGIVSLNGQTLTFNGPIIFPTSVANGSFTGSSTSSISIATPAGGAITNSMFMTQTSSSTNSLNNITLNRTGQTLTLGNPLNLIGKLTPTVGTFASAGNLTLVATSPTVSAWIGTIGGSVTGNVTVQSYEASGNTGWCLMGAAGVTGQNFTQWNNAFQITCPTCPNGCCPGGSAFTSVYSYLETVGGLFSNSARYVGISNITDPITIGKGYWVYLGNATTTTTDIIVSTTGPINQGNFVYTITMTNAGGGTNATDHGYNLLANPYPAPINWTSLRAGNASVANAIYAYNPDLSGYASCVGGVSAPAVGSGGIGNMIAAGQGFYVKASAATTLTAKEAFKAASAQQLVRMANPNQTQSSSSSSNMVFRLTASNSTMKNETAIYFTSNATTNYDIEYDALSLGVDAGFLGITSVMSDTAYAINGLPALTGNLSIPIKATTGTTGSYQITPSDMGNLPSGACVKLHDNYMHTDWDLRTGAYNCTLTDTETVARFVLNITLDNTLSVSSSFQNPTCAHSANGYMIANASGTPPYNYYWKDTSNNIIRTSLNNMGADTLKNANAGNYHVDVNTSGTCNNGTVTFTLQGTSSPNATFSVPSATYTLVNDTALVSFTNNSTNSNTYLWDFGDGTQAADTNTVYPYTSAGVYVVTLMAFNQACGDTAYYSQLIMIDTASLAGIEQVANSNVVSIYPNPASSSLQVTFSGNIQNTTIEVYNTIGECVHRQIATSSNSQIDVSDLAEGVYNISLISNEGVVNKRVVIVR